MIKWAVCSQTEFYRMLARLMLREIHADVITEISLVECLREMEERSAKLRSEGFNIVGIMGPTQYYGQLKT